MTNSVISEQTPLPAGGTLKGALRGLALSLLINVGLPLLLIYILTTYMHASELLRSAWPRWCRFWIALWRSRGIAA